MKKYSSESFIRMIAFCVMSVIFSLPAYAANEVLLDHNTGKPVRYAGELSSANVMIPSAYKKKTNEFRGIWVATVENIDLPKHQSAADFKKKFISILDNVKRAGFTALIFQVCPTHDAFYPSKYAPYSKFLAGKEGTGFSGFDPLEFMVAETHKRGMEFHAWLNPYRVTGGTTMSKQEYLNTLSPRSFAVKNPHLLLTVPSGGKNLIILNPGEPECMQYILNIVDEIIKNYDVDAIHMDDYFYPYDDIGTLDMATYKKYAKQGMTLAGWRRNNVDTLVNNIGIRIRTHNRTNRKNVRFGISPFGIWANKTTPESIKNKRDSHAAGSLTKGSQSYFTQYADTRRWVKEGWIDYIAPQLYWSFNHNVAAYAALVDWWVETVRGTRVDLYIGHAPSRLGVNPDWKNANELVNQLKYNCLHPEVKGSIFFSYIRMFEPGNPTQKEGSRRVIEDTWKMKATQK